MWAGLGKLDHVDNVTDEIDLEGALTQGRDVGPLDDTAQDFCGLRMASDPSFCFRRAYLIQKNASDRHAERVDPNSDSSF